MENTVVRLRRELAEEKLLTRDAKENEFILKFSERLGRNMMLVLSNTRFDDWPPLAKAVFEYENRKTPTLAHMYLNRHRKMNP